jgi:hypothetical protein
MADFNVAQAWKELPTWAKWTVGLGGAGAVLLLLMRGRSASAPTSAPSTPVTYDSGGSGSSSGPDWSSVISGLADSQAQLAGQVQQSQAQLAAQLQQTQSMFASTQSQLISQMQQISWHLLSPGAVTGSAAVPLSGGAVASDKDSQGPGTSGAVYASGQQPPSSTFTPAPAAVTQFKNVAMPTWVDDNQNAGWVNRTVQVNQNSDYEVGIATARQAYKAAWEANDQAAMDRAHAEADRWRTLANQKHIELPDWAR